jgi:peptidyl-prolyl cis-trans isomerase SurA
MKRIGMMIVLLAALWTAATLADPVTVDGVAAYVNDSVITVSEVREAMTPLLPSLKELYQGAELRAKLQETFNDVLQDLIENKLILRAYDADAKVSKDAVEKLVERRVKDFIEERFGGDRQDFMKALKEERMSMEEWRRRMRERLIVGMMRQKEVDSQVVIPPREVRRVYEEGAAQYQRPERVRLRVIVIHAGTNETDRVARLKLAVESLAKVKGDESFEEVARRVSEDSKAPQGGNWGWVDVADLRKELAAAIQPLGAGGLTGVVLVEGDMYVVKVEERQAAGVTPFDEVRGAIEKDLKRKESRRLHKLWIDRLRKDAYVEIVQVKEV